MSEKFVSTRNTCTNEFLDLNHTRNILMFVSFLIPKFVRIHSACGGELRNRDTIALEDFASPPLGFAFGLVVMCRLHENGMRSVAQSGRSAELAWHARKAQK